MVIVGNCINNKYNFRQKTFFVEKAKRVLTIKNIGANINKLTAGQWDAHRKPWE